MNSEPPVDPHPWQTWQRQIATLTLLVMVPLVFWLLRPVWSPLLITFALAFILRYPIRLLHKRLNLSYRFSVIIVYLIFLVLLFLVFIWLISFVADFMVNLLIQLEETVDALVPAGDGLDTGPLQSLLRPVSLLVSGDALFSSVRNISSNVAQLFSAIPGFIGGLALVVVLLIFFLLEWPRSMANVLNKFPAGTQRELRLLSDQLVSIVENYTVGSLIVAGFYWLLATVQFWLTGVPNAILGGFLVGAPNVVPNFGGYISTVLVFILALLQGSETISMNRLALAFLEMVIFMVVSGITYYIVDVRIFSRSVRIPIWVLLVGQVVFSATFGLVGFLIAPAAIAALFAIMDFVLKKTQGRDPFPANPPEADSKTGEQFSPGDNEADLVDPVKEVG